MMNAFCYLLLLLDAPGITSLQVSPSAVCFMKTHTYSTSINKGHLYNA